MKGLPHYCKYQNICTHTSTCLMICACNKLSMSSQGRGEHFIMCLGQLDILCMKLGCLAAGLMTDAPAVEVWLLCSEPVSVPPQCLAVQLAANSPVNGSYYPEFNEANGNVPASSFRYIVRYSQSGSVLDILGSPSLFGIVTLDLEQARSASETLSLAVARKHARLLASQNQAPGQLKRPPYALFTHCRGPLTGHEAVQAQDSRVQHPPGAALHSGGAAAGVHGAGQPPVLAHRTTAYRQSLQCVLRTCVQLLPQGLSCCLLIKVTVYSCGDLTERAPCHSMQLLLQYVPSLRNPVLTRQSENVWIGSSAGAVCREHV